MTAAPKMRKSIHGQMLGMSHRGNLVAEIGAADIASQRRVNVTQPAAVVTGSISAEGATVANQRDITIQLKDVNGDNIAYAEMIEVYALLNAAGTDFAATGGSTGIAIGASGKLLTTVAKKAFVAITTTAGLLTLTYTDTGTEAVYLGVRLPNGNLIVCGNLTCA